MNEKFDVNIYSVKTVLVIFLLLISYAGFTQNNQTFKKYQSHGSSREGLTSVKLNNKWGFVDKSGKLVIPTIYDYEGVFQNGVVWIQLKGKWGMVDKKDKCLVPFRYDKISWLGQNKPVILYLNGKCGLFTDMGQPLCPMIYDSIDGTISDNVFKANRLSVRLNGKYGYINTAGKLVIPIEYSDAKPFQYCGLASVKLNGYYGCIDVTGKTVIPCKYLAINPFEPRIAMANLNGYLGWININGKIVLPFEYQDAKNWFHENGLTTVEKDGKWGAIDTAGRLFIPCKYDEPTDFNGTSEASMEVHVNGKIGILGFSGKEIIPPKYDSAYTAPGGVCLNKKWAIINKDGQEVTPFLYDWASAAEWGGCNQVRLHGKMGLVSNSTGKPLIPLKYKSIEDFYDRKYIYIVNYNNKFGVLDNNGEQLIPTEYDSLHYTEKTFSVRLNNKWGFLNDEGKVLINPQYDNATVLRDGYAIVKKNGKWGSIDMHNNTVIPFKYQNAINMGGGEAMVCLNNKWGLVDKHNKVLTPIKYTLEQLEQLLEDESDTG